MHPNYCQITIIYHCLCELKIDFSYTICKQFVTNKDSPIYDTELICVPEVSPVKNDLQFSVSYIFITHNLSLQPMGIIRQSWKGRGPLYTEYGISIRCVRKDQTAAVSDHVTLKL